MQYLRQSAFGRLQLSARRLLGLRDEDMQHDDALPDNAAVECPCYPLWSLDPQLDQPVPNRARVRHAQVWAELVQQLDQPQIARQQAPGTLRIAFSTLELQYSMDHFMCLF